MNGRSLPLAWFTNGQVHGVGMMQSRRDQRQLSNRWLTSKMNTGAGQGTGFYGLSSSGDRLIGTVQTEAKHEPKLLTVVGDGSSGSVKQ